MKVIVHRGTRQIGGCITEIQSSKGTRIIIDIGENLPSSNVGKQEELKLEGLTEGKASYDAVFVTHYHGDHIGLYSKILPEIPIYIGKISKGIFSILQRYLARAHLVTQEELQRLDNLKAYQIPNKVQIKDITITPIEVDHSAFNAHMFLIECDNKKVLHTGDFRIHGQRGPKVLPAIEKYVGQVDCLICEGTTLSREKEPTLTENEIQRRAEEIFQHNKCAFVMCSSTNIDRIAAFHKAAVKEGRIFVCDEYQKEILNYIESVTRSSLYQFKGKILSYAPNILKLMEQKGFVMLVRNDKVKSVMTKFPETVFVYSNWLGYLDEKNTQYKYIQEAVPKDYIYLHTSGHADYEAIQKVCQIVKPKILIPIHGEKPEVFQKMKLENCEIKLKQDKEEIIL